MNNMNGLNNTSSSLANSQLKNQKEYYMNTRSHKRKSDSDSDFDDNDSSQYSEYQSDEKIGY